jgi:hypothetical protein
LRLCAGPKFKMQIKTDKWKLDYAGICNSDYYTNNLSPDESRVPGVQFSKLTHHLFTSVHRRVAKLRGMWKLCVLIIRNCCLSPLPHRAGSR